MGKCPRCETLLERLRDLEWSGVHRGGCGHTAPACPMCHGLDPNHRHDWVEDIFPESLYGHRPDCRLASDFAEAESANATWQSSSWLRQREE